jgi:hypothetical protein
MSDATDTHGTGGEGVNVDETHPLIASDKVEGAPSSAGNDAPLGGPAYGCGVSDHYGVPTVASEPRSRLCSVLLGAVAGLLLTGGVLLGGCAVVSAQPAPAQQQEPPGPPPAGQVPLDRLGPDISSPEGDPGRRPGSSAPGGVIRPPAGVDPGIRAPAPNPNPGTTPVIPPPGTPGGDPRVEPR